MNPIGRILLIAGGLVSVGLGIAGAFLPLLPTTPFLLLAAYLFARSSPSLHGWLLNHSMLGPIIVNWERYGVIPLRAKVLALLLLAWSLAFSVWMDFHVAVLAVQGVVCGGVAVFLLTRPSNSDCQP